MLEDRRTQHPLMQIPAVDLAPLPALVSQPGKLRLILLNCFQPYNLQMISKLAATGKVYFDIATLEGIGGIKTVLQQVPANHLLFGSNAPLFYFESALLKLQESTLTEFERARISSENARGLTESMGTRP
jgi:predicted TIM-barrel fold metal-dependent hydrolase